MLVTNGVIQKNEPISKLTQSGFRVDYVGSFYCVLFPLMLVSRLKAKFPAKGDSMATAMTEFNISTWLNQVPRAVMWLDELSIGRGRKLSFSASLLAVRTVLE